MKIKIGSTFNQNFHNFFKTTPSSRMKRSTSILTTNQTNQYQERETKRRTFQETSILKKKKIEIKIHNFEAQDWLHVQPTFSQFLWDPSKQHDEEGSLYPNTKNQINNKNYKKKRERERKKRKEKKKEKPLCLWSRDWLSFEEEYLSQVVHLSFELHQKDFSQKDFSLYHHQPSFEREERKYLILMKEVDLLSLSLFLIISFQEKKLISTKISQLWELNPLSLFSSLFLCLCLFLSFLQIFISIVRLLSLSFSLFSLFSVFLPEKK